MTSNPNDRQRFSVKQRRASSPIFGYPLILHFTGSAFPLGTMGATTPRAPPKEQEPSRFDSLKNNVSYLAYGSAAGAAVPASFKTRTILKTTRYVLKYIFYRLIRYAKYAVIVRSRWFLKPNSAAYADLLRTLRAESPQRSEDRC